MALGADYFTDAQRLGHELRATVWSSCPGSFWRSMHRRIGWLRLTPWSILSSKDGPASKMWPGCSVARCARCARCAGTSNNSGMAAWRLWAAPADTPKGAGACEQHTLALIGRLQGPGLLQSGNCTPHRSQRDSHPQSAAPFGPTPGWSRCCPEHSARSAGKLRGKLMLQR